MAATEHDVRVRARSRVCLRHLSRLTLLLGALALISTSARGDGRSSGSVFVYTDDDRLTVVHPAVSAAIPVGSSAHANVRYEVDAVSAATIDVRTAASPRGFTETRHGVGLGADAELTRSLRLEGGYSGSFSPDYETHAGRVGLALDDDDKSTTAALALSVAHDTVARVRDPSPVGTIDSLGITLGVTRVLTRIAVADLRLALEHQAGYLESPYRFVPIAYADGDLGPLFVSERVPDSRVRAALEGMLRLSLSSHVFTRAQWRLHADDWGIAGHTIRLRVGVDPIEPWVFSTFASLYVQRGASFYRGRYTTAPQLPSLRTLDRELAPTDAVGLGLRAERALGTLLDAQLRVDAQVELTYQRNHDTPRLPERTTAIAGLSLSAEY